MSQFASRISSRRMQDSFSPFFPFRTLLTQHKRFMLCNFLMPYISSPFSKPGVYSTRMLLPCPLSYDNQQVPKQLHFYTSYRVPFPLCNHRGKSFTVLWQKQVRYFIFQDATPSFSITEMSFIINSWGRGDNDFPSLHTEAFILQMDLLITASFWLVQQIKTGFKVPLPSTKPKRYVSH